MADILMDEQGTPAAPSANTGVLYLDSTSKELVNYDGTGKIKTVRTLTNGNTGGDVTCSSVDTYLTGSNILIPPATMRVGTQILWRFMMTKNNLGTATCIWTPRFGTAASTADTALTTFTMGAQTAATDTGWADGHLICRTAGASGVIELSFLFQHGLAVGGSAAVGMNAQLQQGFQFTSGAITLNTANLQFGWSCNPGASAIWTFQHVAAWGMSL